MDEEQRIPELLLPEIPKDLKLRPREFLRHYLTNGFNATEAAISAGYSKKTARQQASQLLRNVKICQYLDQLSENAGIQIHSVLQEINRVAFSNPEGLPDWQAKLRALEMLRRHLGGGADTAAEQLKAGEGVTVVIVGGPFGFDRQEPTERQEIEE